MKFKIKNRWSAVTQFECEAETLVDAVVAAVRAVADLVGADLAGADLRGANLRGANLRGADLRGADLRGAKINWQSHDLLAEILRRAAGRDKEKLKIAGLILVDRASCWDDFLQMEDPLKEWALGTLAACVIDGDSAPASIRDRAEPLKK